MITTSRMFHCGAFHRHIVSNNQAFNIMNVVSSRFAQDKPRQEVDATPWGIPGSSSVLCRAESMDFRR